MLLDTSGLLCFLNKNEPLHEQAVQLFSHHQGIFLIHNYILAELIALSLVRKFSRFTVLSFIQDLTKNPQIETVWVDSSLHQKAIKLLIARQDKTYSLCDAVSFVLMRQRNIINSLTTDKHFEQEGFVRLLKSL